MPAYTEPKSYADGSTLTEAMLDEGKSYRETFLNTTKLDASNIQNGAITNALLRNSVGTSVIGRASSSTGAPADITATGDGQILQRSGGTLSWAQLSVDNVPNNLITDALLRQSAACSVVGRSANSTGNVADITSGSDNQVLQRQSGALTFDLIQTANIAAGAVTQSRLGARSALFSSGVDDSTTSTNYVTKITYTPSYTFRGDRPVLLVCVPTADDSYFGVSSAGGNDIVKMRARITCDGGSVAWASVGGSADDTSSGNIREEIDGPGLLSTVVSVSSGSHTFTVDIRVDLGGGTAFIKNVALAVWEL